MTRKSLTALAVFLPVLFVLLAPAALSQDEPLREEREGLTGDREVYIPFRDLEKVFEKEGQGVFVPYEEFLRLWKADLDRRPVPEKPPVDWLITRAAYEGRVEGDLAVVGAEIEFETFRPGWSTVPLGFGGVALGEARLGDAEATLEALPEGGYRVLVPEAGTYRLSVGFVTGIARQEDTRTIAFQIPATPVSRVVFDVPEEEARVTVNPNLATTRTEPGSGVTRVMAYVGAADRLELSWKPRPVELKRGPALLFADTAVETAVEETVLRVKAHVDLTIHRAPLEEFALEMANPGTVLFVEGEDLRSWEVAEGEPVLKVVLGKPAERSYRLAVTMEVPLPDAGPVAVPSFRVSGASREQGFVLVKAPATVKVLPQAQGLYRTDFGAVPEALRGGGLVYAWRYPAFPWSLGLDVTRIEPVVDVAVRTVTALDERRVNQTDVFTFTVEKVGIFGASIALPEGMTVTDVSRDTVDDWRVVEEDGGRRLELAFPGSRLGTFAVTVVTTREQKVGEEPVEFALPVLGPLGVRRVEGLVGIVRDEALKLETVTTTGLTPVEAAAFGGGASAAYRYRGAGPAAVFRVSRRDPEVTAVVTTTLTAEQNRVAVKSLILFTVRYAGVEEFSFLLPEEVREQVQVKGNNLRSHPQEDAEEGLFRQKIELQGKVMGEYPLLVEYDLPFGKGLETGQSREADIPSLRVENVEREQGCYAVVRDPALQIEALPGHPEAIDPRELPAQEGRPDVFLAFKYLSHPHALALKIVKHEFVPVLDAVVHHRHLVTLMNEEGTFLSEMVFSMTNNGLQFLSLRFPEGTTVDTIEVRVRDRSGNVVQRGEKPRLEGGAYLVKMPPEAGPDDRFAVRVAFRKSHGVPGWIFHPYTFVAPAIQDGEIPVLGTTWFVYPPVDVKLTAAGGTLAWLDRSDSWWARVAGSFPELVRRRQVSTRVAPPGGDLAGMIELAPQGQERLAFGGREQETVEVRVSWARRGAFLFVKILLLLVALLGGTLGLRAAKPTGRFLYLAGCIALPLLFAPLSGIGLAEILVAVMVGGLLAAVYWCARGVAGAIRGGPAGEEA